MVCLIGSGVGASIIGNGVAERAGTSSGTEWGHTTIVVGGRDCRCGSLGHLEAYVGAEAILDRYGLPLPGDDEESALAALVELAGTSPEAARVLDETALYLGAGIADLINLFSPDRIILGGWAGLLLGQHMLPAIRASAREHALSHPFDQTTITVGRVGPDAVARGAATLPIQAFLNGTAAPRRAEPPRTTTSAPPAPAASAEAPLAGALRAPARRTGRGRHDAGPTAPPAAPTTLRLLVAARVGGCGRRAELHWPVN